jgi:hypothetical protein
MCWRNPRRRLLVCGNIGPHLLKDDYGGPMKGFHRHWKRMFLWYDLGSRRTIFPFELSVTKVMETFTFIKRREIGIVKNWKMSSWQSSLLLTKQFSFFHLCLS